jgi:hypothetical protein
MNPRPPQTPAGDADRDHELGAALSGLPVPDHGPTFWADLSTRLQGERPVQTPSATEAGPAATEAETTPISPIPVSLSDRRERRAARRGRTSRSLGAAAAAVTLVVVAAGAVAVIRQGDGRPDSQVSAGRPTTTTAGDPAPPEPVEFSATYDGIEGWDGPDGCCSTWRLTVSGDGSFRWTSTDGRADMAYDYFAGRHVEMLTIGPDVSPDRPRYLVTTGVPAAGPDLRVARPEPLGPMADFVVALARAGDPRITQSSVAGRATWHYDGPTAVDRLGGDGAPNHAIADVDQATGVLLHLTRRVDDLVVNRFTASDAVARPEPSDRAQFRLEPPPGANVSTVELGFDGNDRTLTDAEAAAAVPYDLLVPSDVPEGFTARSVMLNRDVPSPTGPEGMNPPATQVVVMTWYGPRPGRFTITLRPSGGEQWDNPFGGEGVVLDSSPVRFELPGRPPLEGSVAVDAPARPHLWGITGDVVVTISGDLSRDELERVAASLRPHGDG